MKTLLFFAIALLSVNVCYAGDITVQWDPNTITPEGYRVFAAPAVGTFDYVTPAWKGPETTCVVTIPDYMAYKFVCRAYQGENESADSNIAYYDPEPPQVVYIQRPGLVIINP